MEVGRTFNPRHGEVGVKMSMAGICGAQLQELRGEKAASFIPHLMGHEGVGHVTWTGRDSKLKEGDRVCLHWMKGDGCDLKGFEYFSLDKEIGPIGAGPCHTWAEEVVCSENRCTSIPDDVPDELAVLLGCPLSTALGVCENDAHLRMGESVLVVGCGGVGLCCIAAARAMGCDVIGGDATECKGVMAFNAGAQAYAWPGHDVPIGSLMDCVIDTTGNPKAISEASMFVAPGGRMILIGQPPLDSTLSFPQGRRMWDGTGKHIIASQGGQCRPQQDFARWISAWRSGHLRIDGIVTHRYPLSEIHQAIDTLKSGKAGRVLLTFQ